MTRRRWMDTLCGFGVGIILFALFLASAAVEVRP